jgi:hypothetical protein
MLSQSGHASFGRGRACVEDSREPASCDVSDFFELLFEWEVVVESCICAEGFYKLVYSSGPNRSRLLARLKQYLDVAW